MVNLYPAPWNLTGKGYILIFRFNKSFVEEQGNVPEFLKDQFVGSFGSVMIVDYNSSDVGPYGELLFIPGKFHYNGKKLYNISKIYVSTMESVINGRENWGIPKEHANLKFQMIDRQRERIVATTERGIIADFTMKSAGMSFPVNTRLLPFPIELLQKHKGKHFYTRFSGSGKAQIANIEGIDINSELFPDIAHHKPILAIKVNPFALTFHKPKIEKL